MVTGPYSLNGVPLRRMNQRYVIGTSTKVDISKVDTKKFDDNYFKRTEAEKKKGIFVDILFRMIHGIYVINLRIVFFIKKVVVS